MRNVRELVGSLTQARVQMIAARALIDNEMAQDAVEGGGTKELKVVELNAQKLSRCLNIVDDVRRWVSEMEGNESPKEKDGPTLEDFVRVLKSPKGKKWLQAIREARAQGGDEEENDGA